MQQEKIDQLAKESSEHKERINSLENSLENVKPLVVGLKEVVQVLHEHAIVMTESTASHNEAIRMIDRIMKRQDKIEDQTKTNTNEIAAARPAIQTMNDLSKKMMYFGFFMVTLSLGVIGFMVKFMVDNQ